MKNSLWYRENEHIIAELIKKPLTEFINFHHNPIVIQLNKRIQELEAKLEHKHSLHMGAVLSQDKHIKALADHAEKIERLGARMAAALYNIRQTNWQITNRDREVMAELVAEWDHRKS